MGKNRAKSSSTRTSRNTGGTGAITNPGGREREEGRNINFLEGKDGEGGCSYHNTYRNEAGETLCHPQIPCKETRERAGRRGGKQGEIQYVCHLGSSGRVLNNTDVVPRLRVDDE